MNILQQMQDTLNNCVAQGEFVILPSDCPPREVVSRIVKRLEQLGGKLDKDMLPLTVVTFKSAKKAAASLLSIQSNS